MSRLISLVLVDSSYEPREEIKNYKMYWTCVCETLMPPATTVKI